MVFNTNQCFDGGSDFAKHEADSVLDCGSPLILNTLNRDTLHYVR